MKQIFPFITLLALLAAGPLQAAGGGGGSGGSGSNPGPALSEKSGGGTRDLLDDNSHSTSRGPGLSLDEAVRQVRRDTGGRVLSASTVYRNGSRVHRIKVLGEDQRVRILTIDAE